ncbi:MAG TPA: MMPL family transporter [Nevskiaceae bacterium]|nr:MMPL family transporter [Nevskiaceae bacterium]
MQRFHAEAAAPRLFRLWSVAVALLVAVFAFEVLPNAHLETNILALLPSNRQDPGLDRALARFTQQLGSHVVFLVGARNFDRARSGAGVLARQLKASDRFGTIRWKIDADWLSQANAVYAPYRGSLLSNTSRHWLETGNRAALLEQAQRALYSPAAFMRRTQAGSDPLDLFGAFLAQTTPAIGGRLGLRDDVLTTSSHGLHYVFVDVKLKGRAFSSAEGDLVAPVIASAVAHAQAQGLDVLASGVILHAIAAAAEAKSQVLRFGIVQFLGLLALLWWAFRSWRVPALALATLAVGFLGAFTAAHFAFDRVHVLTLVFGCNLAGVAIDYCVYFCADQFRVPGAWRPVDAMASVGGAISVGMVVSVLSYAVLATTPFPGLRQMAVFCAAGLVVAWACVLCWYPRLVKPVPAPAAHTRAAGFAHFDGWLVRGLAAVRRPLWGAFVLVLLLAVVVGLLRLRFEDDVRVLQDAPQSLVHQDQAVARLVGGGMDRRFFLVRGSSTEAVLERSEALDARLSVLQAHGAIGSFSSVTQALPSLRRQKANHALLAARVYDGNNGLLASFMHRLGFSSAQITSRLVAFKGSDRPLRLDRWLPTPAADPYRHLWLGAIGGGQFAAVTTLSDVHAAAALGRAASRLPGVRLLDPVARASAVLGAYRVRVLWLTAFACVLSVLLLATYFRRRSDLALAATPAAAIGLTLAALGLAGVAVNLFNVVALLLVLGLSVDYAIFTQRGRARGYSMLLPVSLAVTATVLTFGLLAISSTPFVRSLGLTVLVGVAIDFTLCLVIGRIGGRQ